MHTRRFITLTLLAALLCCARSAPFAAAPAGDASAPQLLVAADGEVVPARLEAVAADGTLRFSADDKPRELTAKDLIRWGSFVDPARGVQVLLSGGDLLVALDARLDGETLKGSSPTFGAWELPIDLVSAIVLRPPHDRKASDQLLDRALSLTGSGDRLLLENGDELTGTITAIDATKVVLKGEAGPLEVKLDALAAVMFDPTLVNKPATKGLRLLVGFRDGSRFTATTVSGDGDSVRLKLPGGASLAAPRETIAALTTLGGRTTYLSDLQPASYRHIPYLTLTWPYRNDRSAAGSQLRAGGHVYPKGLGMHSPARITYDLDGDYRRFDAEVAIDDETNGGGSVAFRVFVDDGSGELTERGSSGTLRGHQPPAAISVDLTGIKRISLLVDFADRGDELDHANWLNARLVK